MHLKTWSQNLTDAVPGGKNCVNCLEKNTLEKKHWSKVCWEELQELSEEKHQTIRKLGQKQSQEKLLNRYAAQSNPETNKEFISYVSHITYFSLAKKTMTHLHPLHSRKDTAGIVLTQRLKDVVKAFERGISAFEADC